MIDPVPSSELGGLIRAALADVLSGPSPALTVEEVCARYTEESEAVQKPAELVNIRLSLKPVRLLFGPTPAITFGPLALMKVRREMIAAGLALRTINQRVTRIKAAFRWACSVELLPDRRREVLASVKGLRRGRGNIPRPRKIRPVDFIHVYRTLPYCSLTVRVMILVQWLTGMRAGELCGMKKGDVDRSDDVWVYRPPDGKSEWRNEDEDPAPVYLGPRVQRLLTPFIEGHPDEYVFSPRESMRLQRKLWRSRRISKVQPSQLDRSRENPRRLPGDRYTTDAYAKAIAKAIARARADGVAVPHWHSHRMRHKRGTVIRKKYGLEGSQAVLRHESLEASQIYAERRDDLARRAAREIG